MSRIFTIAPLSMLAAFVITSLATGCSFDDPFATKGENGVADFSLSSAQCALGCRTDTPVLLGSSITVQATVTTHTEDALFLQVADGSMGSAAPSTQSCACSGTGSVTCTSTCPSGQDKKVTVTFDVQTKAAGNPAILLVDGSGAVVDRTTLTVRAAKTITATVRTRRNGTDLPVNAGADGAFTVPVGNEVDVSFKTMDDQGNDLAFTQHGVIPTYANATALAPTKDIVDSIFGLTNKEVAQALAAGDDQITLAAQGTSTVLRFHVVK